MIKEDKVTNSNMPYRNLTSKEYINKLKNAAVDEEGNRLPIAVGIAIAGWMAYPKSKELFDKLTE